MTAKLLCFWLLLLFGLSRATEKTCLKSASSCSKCIQSSSMCAWCTSPKANVRCSTLNGLQKDGCPEKFIYDPRSSVEVIRNDSSCRTDADDTKTLFLQPQEVSLHLRPGASQSFPLTLSMPKDQPELNMDLSAVPAGVNITIKSITKGNPQVLQVNVEASQCPSDQNETRPWSILITPRGFSLSVNLTVTLMCQCDCTGNREEDSADCGGQGALVCSRCECYEPYFGQRCQINGDSFLLHDENMCRSGPNAPVCSGSGQCVAGYCECNKRDNPGETYSGQYCECNNFVCPRYNNRVCGGNGICVCGICVCHAGWTGEACSCNLDATPCKAKNQMLCNGRGVCSCGTCQCEPPYRGPTCEDCPVCPKSCQMHAACAECHVLDTGAKMNICGRECESLTVKMVETKEELPTETVKLCKTRSPNDSCFFYFTVSSLPSGGQLTVARAQEC